MLIDSGFVRERAVRQLKENANGQPTGVRVLAAVKRQAHGRTLAQLEQRADPPAPPADATFGEHLAHHGATKAGRELYRQRQQTVEPVFGILKAALGFRRFSPRGKAQVQLEWTLVTMAYNLKRLANFGLGAKLAIARA